MNLVNYPKKSDVVNHLGLTALLGNKFNGSVTANLSILENKKGGAQNKGQTKILLKG